MPERKGSPPSSEGRHETIKRTGKNILVGIGIGALGAGGLYLERISKEPGPQSGVAVPESKLPAPSEPQPKAREIKEQPKRVLVWEGRSDLPQLDKKIEIKLFGLGDDYKELARDAVEAMIQLVMRDAEKFVQDVTEDQAAPAGLRSANTYAVETVLSDQKIEVAGVGPEVDQEKITAVIQQAVANMLRTTWPEELRPPGLKVIVQFPTGASDVTQRLKPLEQDPRIIVNVINGLTEKYESASFVSGGGHTARTNKQWAFDVDHSAYVFTPLSAIFDDTGERVEKLNYQRTPVTVILRSVKKNFPAPESITLPVIVTAEVMHALLTSLDVQQIATALEQLPAYSRADFSSLIAKNKLRNEAAVHAAHQDWFLEYARQAKITVPPRLFDTAPHRGVAEVGKLAPHTSAGAKKIIRLFRDDPATIDRSVQRDKSSHD